LHLNARKNLAFCNPCGRAWDSIALVMALKGGTFAEAVRELAGIAG
jgi:DNA primase